MNHIEKHTHAWEMTDEEWKEVCRALIDYDHRVIKDNPCTSTWHSIINFIEQEV